PGRLWVSPKVRPEARQGPTAAPGGPAPPREGQPAAFPESHLRTLLHCTPQPLAGIMTMSSTMPSVRPLAVLMVFCLAGSATPQSQASTDLRPDAALQQSLEATAHKLKLGKALHDRRLAMSLVDVTDQTRPRYAGLNDQQMMYAASLPKIAILV